MSMSSRPTLSGIARRRASGLCRGSETHEAGKGSPAHLFAGGSQCEGQLRGEGAFADATLAGQDQDLCPRSRQGVRAQRRAAGVSTVVSCRRGAPCAECGACGPLWPPHRGQGPSASRHMWSARGPPRQEGQHDAARCCAGEALRWLTWLGHPAQAAARPASPDWTPGQSWGAPATSIARRASWRGSPSLSRARDVALCGRDAKTLARADL